MIALIVVTLALVPDGIGDLIERLGAFSIDERESATSELTRKGKAVEARLREALEDSADLEVQARLRLILENLANQVEANAVRITVTRRGCSVETLAVRPCEPQRLAQRNDGSFSCVRIGPLTYDRRKPRDLLLPILTAEVERPFEIDPPAALELLTRLPGYDELVPVLERRLRRSADPLVKSICRRAIERQQEGEMPCHPCESP